MSVSPQPMYDNHGNKIGVFISMEEWKLLEKNTSLDIVPEWEQRLALQGLDEYRRNPDAVIDWETFRAEMDADDAAL